VRSRHRRWSPFRSWSARRPLAVATTCIMVLGLGWIPAGLAAPAAAMRQVDAFEGVDGNRYESPTWGYTLEWDEDVWEVVEATSSRRRDRLHLRSDESELFVDGLSDFAGDATECLAERIATLIDRATEAEPLQDDEGNVIEGEDDERAFAAFVFIGSILEDEPEADDETESVAYIECRTLVPGEAVIQILHVAPVEAYPDEAVLVAELLETLTIPAAEEGAEEDDGTDEEPTEVAGEEPTEEPTEEAEEEPTEEATEEAEEDGEAPGDAGVDGDAYTSPTFGYTLEWDGEAWQVEDATSEDDVDTLVLSNGVSTLTITGLAGFDGDPAACRDETAADLEGQEGVESFEPAVNEDGEPIVLDEADRAGAVFVATVDGQELVFRVDCRVLVEGEAVVRIVQEVAADDFDAQIGPVQAVLGTLTLAGEDRDEEPAEEETPEPDEEETPEAEDEETPEAAEEDEEQEDGEGEFADAGVDGNAYVSPQFGFSLEWNADDWDVNAATSDVTGDFVQLVGRRGFISFLGIEQFGGDPLVCFENFADFLAQDEPPFTVEEFEPFEDEAGEVVEGEEDDRVFGAFRSVVADEDGIEQEFVYYLECRTLVPDEAVLVILQVIQPPSAYELASESRDEILATLEIPDAGGDEEDEEPANGDGRGIGDDPVRDDGDEDEDEDEADDRDEADAPGTGSLRSYTSDAFGYTVSWDRADWTLTNRVVEDGRDLIELSAESGLVTIEGQTRFAGDPAACLNAVTTNLRAIPGVEDWTRVDDTSLLPEGRARGGAVALFRYTLAPEGRTPTPHYAYVECRVVVPGEVVLAIVYTVPVEDYEAERAALEVILASIQLPE
jgi:hypothetical protein